MTMAIILKKILYILTVKSFNLFINIMFGNLSRFDV